MKNLIAISLVVMIAFTSCNDSRCVEGGGSLNDYSIDVNTFDKISVAGPIDINITQGNSQSVTIMAEPEIYGVMEHKVKDGELIVDFENRSCIRTDLGVTLNVTVADLQRIEVSGISTIQTIGELHVDRLNIQVSGTAETQLSGSAVSQSVDVSGILDSYNFDFQTEQIDLDVSGTADMEVSCSDNLDVKVSGAAAIAYKGTPRITQDVSGTINLVNSN